VIINDVRNSYKYIYVIAQIGQDLVPETTKIKLLIELTRLSRALLEKLIGENAGHRTAKKK
jgi:hypothetical protein